MHDNWLCDYELPSKPFAFCKRKATVRIDRNGCYCGQHARTVLAVLKREGKERYVERLAKKGT